jgi:hypothetical protein
MGRTGLGLAVIWATAAGTPALAQQAGTAAEVVASEISISREEAVLRLDLADGRSVEVAVRGGGAYVDGTRVGAAPRGGPLDRAWRDLLNRGMDAASAELPALLSGWTGPGETGTRLGRAMEEALQTSTAAADAAAAAPDADSVTLLRDRVAELERMVRDAESRAAAEARAAERRARAAAPPRARSPFRYISEGLSGVFSLLVGYAVLFAIGFGVIVFGGRQYIEGVADTARHATSRSLLVGLAATFLIIPAFILGIIALVVSIVGIPALIVWLPGFPLALVLAVLLGYLGVAHAAGEVLAERRFYVTDWFQRGNSYFFLLSGLGLLLSFFLAAHVVHMAGPWLGVVRGMLMFLGFTAGFLAVTIGFGAVLLSRAGSQPLRPRPAVDEADLFAEEAGV